MSQILDFIDSSFLFAPESVGGEFIRFSDRHGNCRNMLRNTNSCAGSQIPRKLLGSDG
jgi:hypothetical protein